MGGDESAHCILQELRTAWCAESVGEMASSQFPTAFFCFPLSDGLARFGGKLIEKCLRFRRSDKLIPFLFLKRIFNELGNPSLDIIWLVLRLFDSQAEFIYHFLPPNRRCHYHSCSVYTLVCILPKGTSRRQNVCRSWP